jgi:hypothetical protein
VRTVRSLKESQRAVPGLQLLLWTECYWIRNLRGMRSNTIFRLAFQAPSLLVISGTLTLYYLTSH